MIFSTKQLHTMYLSRILRNRFRRSGFRQIGKTPHEKLGIVWEFCAVWGGKCNNRNIFVNRL